jgi:excisionase family DNA binding protein
MWLTVKEAAARAKCSTKLIYLAVRRGQLRASRLGVRRDIRILESWLDSWMMSLSIEPESLPLPFGRNKSRY